MGLYRIGRILHIIPIMDLLLAIVSILGVVLCGISAYMFIRDAWRLVKSVGRDDDLGMKDGREVR